MSWTPVPGVKVVTMAKAAIVCLAAVILSGVIGAGVGFFAGRDWQQGRQAKADLRQADADIAALGQQITEFRGALSLVSQDLQKAGGVLQGISEEYSNDRQAQARIDADLQRSLEHALRQRPDLDRVHVGAELLRAWNAANGGRADTGGAAGAGQPAPERGDGADAAVPGGAAAGTGRRPAGPDPQSPRERGDLPRLPTTPRTSGRSHARPRAARSRADRARQDSDAGEEEVDDGR